MFESNLTLVGLAVAILFYGALLAYFLRKPFAEGLRRFRALPRMVQVAMAVVAAIATVEAQKQQGSTNEPPANAPGPLGGGGAMPGLQPQFAEHGRLVILGPWLNGEYPHPSASLNLGGGEPTVSAEDVLRGYKLAFVTNDAMHDHAMPANAQRLGNVHVHGAASSWGRNILDFGDWSFPLGTNETAYSRLWWFVDGRLRAAPHNAVSEISVGARGALAVQGESRLWWAAGEGDSRVVGWENVFLGGGTNEAASLQVVLRPDGSFETWSNDVGAVYARIDPNDWDGDGLDNSIDVQLMTYSGDCFGTGVDWLNGNCGNVLFAFPGTNGEIFVEWHSNVCESAYYWLQFTAQKDRTRVTITCDGPSNLGDLFVIANSNQVCTVPLLIGAVYSVRASWPVTDISSSDPEANITLNAGSPPGLRGAPIPQWGGQTFGPSAAFGVERSISLGLEGGGGTGQLVTSPYVGAEISSVTGSCCEVMLNGVSYSWGCSGNCECSGYGQWWEITATWEGYSKVFAWEEQCGCHARNESDPEAWVSLSATPVVMRGGWLGSVSATFQPPESAAGATATLRLDDGGKVVPWGTENRTGAVSLPMSIPPSGGGSFWLEGVEVSDTVGDVRIYLEVNDGSDTYTLTQLVTVACVDRMEMTSTVSGTSSNPPPFPGEQACPFLESNSLNPDKHLVVPFCNVATQGQNGFTISDFTVEMELVLEPEGVSASGLQVEWEVAEARPQMSGSLIPLAGLAARFSNPKHGGVYRFRSRVNGSPWTEGNVVLPLSGASIDAQLAADMAAVDATVTFITNKYSYLERQTISFGEEWFYDNGVGDYLGRVDNATWRTVWNYNQVNDLSGMGAVATWHGVPTRMAKVSNFLVAYETERIGVWAVSQWLARLNFGRNDFGVDEDDSASGSWNAGIDIANGGDFGATTLTFVTNAWSSAGDKERKLWPNPSAADNHTTPFLGIDWNYNFVSPGFTTKRN